MYNKESSFKVQISYDVSLSSKSNEYLQFDAQLVEGLCLK